jgi:hypothetical protein
MLGEYATKSFLLPPKELQAKQKGGHFFVNLPGIKS